MLAQRLRTMGAALLCAAGLAVAAPTNAHANATSVGKTNAGVTRSQPSSGGKPAPKRSRGRRGRFDGRSVSEAELRKDPLPVPSGHVVVNNPALHETLDLQLYNPDGTYNQASLAALDHIFRCRKTDEERAMDPRLYQVLSMIYDRFGKPIDLNSGFRYQRNEGSRHFHGSAMDVSIPSVGYREIYAFATKLDAGGMGIGRYPTGGFVHIDFRAPGEPSYRWTDTHGSSNSDPGKMPSKMWKRSTRPNS
jgi:uncharacterized protein YcbK (DUF882 family)